MSSPLVLILPLALLCLLISPAAAFGAGDIPDDHGLNGYLWRHGDISSVLLSLPCSYLTHIAFSELDRKRVYFGNWLRDYSQLIDVACLKRVDERTLRAIISVLAFMHFSLATEEFDVTKQKIGCYSHVEHIDNPKGYPNDAKKYDARLRGPVQDIELAIDPKTGMKNYIANEGQGWDTSAHYVAQQLLCCVDLGRKMHSADSEILAEQLRNEALRYLGNALHTLEDFPAHSNFVELCLHKLGVTEVFTFVGDECRVKAPNGQSVPPLVTGTFGMTDVLHSLLAEVDDRAATKTQGSLNALTQNMKGSVPLVKKSFSIIQGLLSKLGVFSSDVAEISNNLAKAHETVIKVQENPGTFDPTKTDIHSGPTPLWESIEPAFVVHDQIRKFLDENGELFKIPLISGVMEELGQCIDEFVYEFLALIIEGAVQEVRHAVEQAKADVETLEAKVEEDIYADGSSDSNPSHSALAKDHYNNHLNPPAGLVAGVLANYTTQYIVRLWENPDVPAAPIVLELLAALHHPAFATGDSKLQEFMFMAVETWWNRNTDAHKDLIRLSLTKEQAKTMKHQCHAVNLDTLEQSGAIPGFFQFPGYDPEIVKVAHRETPAEQVEAVVLGVSNTVNEAVSEVGNGISDFASRTWASLWG